MHGHRVIHWGMRKLHWGIRNLPVATLQKKSLFLNSQPLAIALQPWMEPPSPHAGSFNWFDVVQVITAALSFYVQPPCRVHRTELYVKHHLLALTFFLPCLPQCSLSLLRRRMHGFCDPSFLVTPAQSAQWTQQTVITWSRLG